MSERLCAVVEVENVAGFVHPPDLVFLQERASADVDPAERSRHRGELTPYKPEDLSRIVDAPDFTMSGSDHLHDSGEAGDLFEMLSSGRDDERGQAK